MLGAIVSNDANRIIRRESEHMVIFDNDVRQLTDVREAPEIVEADFQRPRLQFTVVVGANNVTPSFHTGRAKSQMPLADESPSGSLVL